MAPPINVVHVQIWPGGIYGLNLFLAHTLLQGFFLVLHFSSLASTKTNISKLQFDQDKRPSWKPADVASSINIVHL